MDLERELREAMAEHVAQASAPASLAADVRHRHRHRVIRIRVTLVVAAAAVVVVAVTPVYHATRAAPSGAPDSTSDAGPATASTAPIQPFAPGSPDPRSSAGAPGAAGTASSAVVGQSPRGGSPDGIRDAVRRWVTYLPAGLEQAGPCVEARSAAGRTMSCQWTGKGGAVVGVRLSTDPGLVEPEDIVSSTRVLQYDQVHGRRAIVAEQPGAGGQVAWIERPGLGVLVEVSAPLRDQLMRIADGVHP